MTNEERNQKITEVSKTILNFCRARTANHHDAEDLAQDILCEIMRAASNIRDDKAFYGFMWSVAENVYKSWYRKKLAGVTEELSETIPDEEDTESMAETDSDIYLLRRELALLSQKFRRASVYYYVDGRPCAEIAKLLDISESMVKYLLFKARKILKEGMTMERNYGTQSYNPKTFTINFLGGKNIFYDPIHDNLIRQNILWACHNDELKEEEIALEIGVGLPYIEKDIELLTDLKLLVRNGSRYRTNIIILTEETLRSIKALCAPILRPLVGKLNHEIEAILPGVKALGFHGADHSTNTLKWNLFLMTLDLAYKHAQKRDIPKSPSFGYDRVWGQEDNIDDYVLNTCYMIEDETPLLFFDYLPKPCTDHHDFWNHKERAKLLAALAEKKPEKIEDYGKETLAELIRLGYVRKEEENFVPAMCVYSEEQTFELNRILEKAVHIAEQAADEVFTVIEKALSACTMEHLKEQTYGIAHASLFSNFVGASLKNAVNEGILSTDWTPAEIATAYLVI